MSLSFDHSYAGRTGFDYCYAVTQACLRSARLACRPFIIWTGQFASVKLKEEPPKYENSQDFTTTYTRVF